MSDNMLSERAVILAKVKNSEALSPSESELLRSHSGLWRMALLMKGISKRRKRDYQSLTPVNEPCFHVYLKAADSGITQTITFEVGTEENGVVEIIFILSFEQLDSGAWEVVWHFSDHQSQLDSLLDEREILELELVHRPKHGSESSISQVIVDGSSILYSDYLSDMPPSALLKNGVFIIRYKQ